MRRISSVIQMRRIPAERGLVPPSLCSSESSSDKEQPTTFRRILSQQDPAQCRNEQNARWPSCDNSAVSEDKSASGTIDLEKEPASIEPQLSIASSRQASHRQHRSRFGSAATLKTADELERKLDELSARTKAALEASWAEIDVLKKERAENAKAVEELQDELRKLHESRKERQRKKAELAAAAAAKKKGISRCCSAPNFLTLRMAGAAAGKKGSANNCSLDKSDDKAAAPAPTLLGRSQSSSTDDRLGKNRSIRRRRSLTERLSEGISQLRRNNNNARAIMELNQRLIELHRHKSSAVSELSQRLKSKDEDLSEARRAVDFLWEEKEQLKKERDALRALGDEENRKCRNEREQLMTMAVELMESVRGKERQLRYMAVCVGQKMASTESAREADVMAMRAM